MKATCSEISQQVVCLFVSGSSTGWTLFEHDTGPLFCRPVPLGHSVVHFQLERARQVALCPADSQANQRQQCSWALTIATRWTGNSIGVSDDSIGDTIHIRANNKPHLRDGTGHKRVARHFVHTECSKQKLCTQQTKRNN